MEKEFFTQKQAEEFYHLLYNEINSINDTNYNADCLLKFFGLYERKDETVADDKDFAILGSEATFSSIALDFLEISKKYAFSRQSYFNIDFSDIMRTLLPISGDKEQYEKTIKSIFGSDFDNQVRLFELVDIIFYRFIFELGLKIKDNSYFNINFVSLISSDIFSQNSPMNEVGMSFYGMFNSNVEDYYINNMNVIKDNAYNSDLNYGDLSIVEFKQGNYVYKASDGEILKNKNFSFFNAEVGSSSSVDFETDGGDGYINHITNNGAGIYSVKSINGKLIEDIYQGDEKAVSEHKNLFIIQSDNDNISYGDSVYRLGGSNNEVVDDGLYILTDDTEIQVLNGLVTH